MVIAFLDLLGFSWLMKYDLSAAYDNLNMFNRIIKTKIIDEKVSPIASYGKGTQPFVAKSSITSFENMISISDSLIIGSGHQNLFVKQISDFVATAYIETNEPFRKQIHDLKKVMRDSRYDIETKQLIDTEKCAFPLMFRGGIAFGNVIFSPEIQIENCEAAYKGLNVCGLAYVEAVNLESTDKGPRLFCNQAFVDTLDDESKKAIRIYKDYGSYKLYELIWTYFAFETLQNSSDKRQNIRRGLNETLLPAAICLYDYFNLKGNDEKIHYLELIRLICKGAFMYAKENGIENEYISSILKYKLDTIELGILDDFV